MSDDVQTVRDALTKGQRDSQLLADVRGTLRDFNEAPWDEAEAALARLVAALSAATTERDEALAQVGAATTILAGCGRR